MAAWPLRAAADTGVGHALTCSAFFAVACAAALASSAYANPQAGQKPVLDCSKIRGVCYGIRPEETARRELAYGARVGLNAVRFWLSRIAYAKAGDRYVKQVVDFVRVCHSCGYKSMPILFNGNGLDPKSIQPEAYAAADNTVSQ